MSDLDACPHCGQAGFARVKRWPWEKEGEPGLVWGYHVICDASGIDTHPRGCGASSGWGETPEEAIAAWSRRAYLAASGEVVDIPDIKLAIADFLETRDEAMGFVSDPEERSKSAIELHDTVQRVFRRTIATPQPAQVAIKPLEWEDADEGMCTKWRAPALGGSYDLVAFEREDGFAVNFYWGRPLSYWFIQGDPDEWGPTGPKMFPTLDAAKAAAQADYENRIRSSLAPSPADGAVEALEAASHFIRDHYEPGIDSEYTLLQQVNAALAALKGDTP